MHNDDETTLRLAIDGNEANTAQRVGSNVYAFELLRALEKQVEQRRVAATILLASPPGDHWPAPTPYWRYALVPPAKYWTQWAAPLYLRRHRHDYDLFFTPGHYAPRHCPIPYVSSVMDTAYLEYPHEFKLKDRLQLQHWTAYSVKHAAAIVTISRFSKKCVIDAYQRHSRDIVVAYPAVAASAQGQQTSQKLSADEVKEFTARLELSDTFFVYVGTLQPRKRLPVLIEAFETLCLRLQEEKKQYRKKHPLRELPQLILAGRIGWLADSIVERCLRSPFAHQIKLPGFVSDAEKQFLLSHAKAAVMVGRHEGFGIPALEAMWVGTIPIVARTASLPEVVGSAGLFVAADNVLQLSNKLYDTVMMTTRERRTYLQRGREQARRFSWDTSAEIVLDALENVAAGRPVSA